MAVKLYESKAWLRQKFLVERMTMAEIAAICGVTEKTIYRYLVAWGLKK